MSELTPKQAKLNKAYAEIREQHGRDSQRAWSFPPSDPRPRMSAILQRADRFARDFVKRTDVSFDEAWDEFSGEQLETSDLTSLEFRCIHAYAYTAIQGLQRGGNWEDLTGDQPESEAK